MCPEFLREGSGVADFFDPPFTVVGTSSAAVASAMTELLGFLDAPPRVVEVRTAEALKYACNAFHATKVSFANELARVFRLLDIDSRQVMELFCEDHSLNISPRYLRPGFAFGGPCLPKDLRSLLHMARMNNVDLPMLAGTLVSNDLTVAEVVDRITIEGGLVVALLGLRESQRATRGDAPRQGLPSEDPRSGGQAIASRRDESSVRGVKTAPPAAIPGRFSARGPRRSRRGGGVLGRCCRDRRVDSEATKAHPGPQRRIGRGSRGSSWLRGCRLVGVESSPCQR